MAKYNLKKISVIIVVILGVVSLVLGSVFIAQGFMTKLKVTQRLAAEKITLGIPEELAAEGDVVDSLEEAENAASTIAEHLKSIAPSYSDLLGDERFDPTKPEQLVYAQGINLENALEIAALAYGVTTIVIASGVFMIIVGISQVLIGVSSMKS
jgi:hypothetical protein